MPETRDEMPEDAPDREPVDASDQDAPLPEPEPAATEQEAAADGQRDSDGIHQLRSAEAGAETDAERPPRREEAWANLYRMLDLPLSLTVVLGETEMPLSEVLNLDTGSVITIDRAPGEPIDLLINGRLFARGEVVVINETFGCRITKLVDDAAATIEIARNGG